MVIQRGIIISFELFEGWFSFISNFSGVPCFKCSKQEGLMLVKMSE